MGFMDMHGGLGRRFGSLGLALAGMNTSVTVTRSEQPAHQGPDSARALRYALDAIRELGLPGTVSVTVTQAIPAHAGLGSGTQLALATGVAVARAFGIDAEPARLAELAGRGLRSGLGVGLFEHGGFIVDGGRGKRTRVPPVVVRRMFPEPWRVLVLFDRSGEGLYGERERDAFAALGPTTGEEAGRMCRLVMMQMLPAIVEQDFVRFADAVTEVQSAVGELFAPVQHGRYTSPRVAAAIEALGARGGRGLGQSSWGPTGFAFFESERAGLQAMRDLREWAQLAQAAEHLDFVLTGAANHGARVEAWAGTARAEAVAIGLSR